MIVFDQLDQDAEDDGIYKYLDSELQIEVIQVAGFGGPKDSGRDHVLSQNQIQAADRCSINLVSLVDTDQSED